MAKTALTGLQEHIETIRKEAYEEGYRAAMKAVTEFAGKPVVAKAKVGRPKSVSTDVVAETAPKQRQLRQAKAAPKAPPTRKRFNRGDNAKNIAEIMATLPNGTGKAAEIRKALLAKGIELPFTSIRHGLGQLQERGEVRVAEDGKTWTHTPQPAA